LFVRIYKKEDEMGVVYSTCRRGEKSIKTLVLKPQGKKTFEKPGCRCENAIRIGSREIG
jgi:hypothetical protein